MSIKKVVTMAGVLAALALFAMMSVSGCGSDVDNNPGSNQNTTYTLTTSVSPPSGGTISRSPDAASYPAGTFVTVTATPASTHTFVNWSGASSSNSNSVIIEMNGNKTITANFQASSNPDPTPTSFCCWPATIDNGWTDECGPIGPSFVTPSADVCRADYGIVQNNSTPPAVQYCLWADGGCWPITEPNEPNYNEGVPTGLTNLAACQAWGTLISSATGCPNYGMSQ